jgi:Fic family protein
MDQELTQLLSEADRTLARLDGLAYTLPDADHFIAMYVRKEALLSSQIEGTPCSLEDVFEVEGGEQVKNINDVEEVINYIAALNYGMKRLEVFPMSLRLIKEIHEKLLKGVRGNDKTPGEFRKSQNWIGPPGATLTTATFVPPTPHDMLTAMDHFEKYLYAVGEYPELIRCALLHYQFETIHPFLDGNGRLGRLLITFYLYWKKVIQQPLLYISFYFKQYRQEYYDRLNGVRSTGDYEQWIKFFLKGVIETSKNALEAARKILALREQKMELLWRNKATSPYAVALLSFLFTKPFVTTKDVEQKFAVSFQTASTLVRQFTGYGILMELTGKKRNKRYCFKAYMDILEEGTKLTIYR